MLRGEGRVGPDPVVTPTRWLTQHQEAAWRGARARLEEMRGEMLLLPPPSPSTGCHLSPEGFLEVGGGEQLDKLGGSGFLEEWKSSVFSSFIFYFIISPKLGQQSPGPEAAVGGVYGF